MKNEDSLIIGFKPNDSRRIRTNLMKLLPYIDTDKMVIVGGLAIRYLLSKAGVDYPLRSFNDLDLMVEDANAVSPAVSKDFLIYHYHPQQGNSFYIVLVDPDSKTKVDIFDWNPPLEKYVNVEFEGYRLKMRSIEDQLVKTVYDIQRISPEKKVDPKQFLDAKLLMEVADIELADKVWKKRNFGGYPKSITKAFERASKIADDHPEWTAKNPFKRPQPYNCKNCKSTSQFKITPMEQIYKVLGYVE